MKNICFQMNRKMWLTMLLALCLALPALAQKVAIQGKVVDSAGEPLIGASVLAQGTTVGVATDFDGNFTIQVAPMPRLWFRMWAMNLRLSPSPKGRRVSLSPCKRAR